MEDETRTPDRTPDGGSGAAGSGSADGSSGVTRKSVLRAAMVAGPAAVIMGATAAGAAPALARDARAGEADESGERRLEPTPTCDDGDDPTPPQMEGPYFKPNSPRKSNIVPPGAPGTPLKVSGFVFGITCRPLANVLLDWWQADTYGQYDNYGYRFRGHQFTGADGGFTLTTLHPGLYPGRTRHLHVKVQAPGQRILTTQLYFPGEPRNRTDPIFDSRLLMNVQRNGTGLVAAFDFVLNVA